MFHPSRSGVGARCIQLLMHLLACCPRCRHTSTQIHSRRRGSHYNYQGALHSTAWVWQFQCVLWFATWICGVQHRGRGCACHSDETECKWKGRRLPEAAVFVDRELSRGLQEAAGPRMHSRPQHPNTWIWCVVCRPRITWLARSLHTCRDCRGWVSKKSVSANGLLAHRMIITGA